MALDRLIGSKREDQKLGSKKGRFLASEFTRANGVFSLAKNTKLSGL